MLNTYGQFLSRTAFAILHKSEPVDVLLRVLWFLPADAVIIVVTNCHLEQLDFFHSMISEQTENCHRIYLVHQKNPQIALFLSRNGVDNIIGIDNLVIDGKGEGMYIATLIASFLKPSIDWIVYFDADNFVPSSLLEYTITFCRLFTSQMHRQLLHNIRVCWYSKPILEDDTNKILFRNMGRCSQVIASLINKLLHSLTKSDINHVIVSSNSGEQAFTVKTAQTVRFASGYAVETFQMLDLFDLTQPSTIHDQYNLLLQQYQSPSPHFHDKKDDRHIKQMIEESLGSFCHFPNFMTLIKNDLDHLCQEQALEPRVPKVYPPLKDILVQFEKVHHHSLFSVEMYRVQKK
ncbi:unnamed protein product [Rotaria sp. Silwood1]|nr:unnamed protein product [Rotaria sp. Silwood1]CAF4842930.1 unnamed protein product [Rotaria sp. Silwood1]